MRFISSSRSRLALFLAVSVCLVAFGSSVQADESEPETKSSPESTGESKEAAPATPSDPRAMYGDYFKCTDGYNPDTDPSLHPPGQDSKVRMLINAQAQKDHEDKLKSEAPAAAAPANESPDGETKHVHASEEKDKDKDKEKEKDKDKDKKETAEKRKSEDKDDKEEEGDKKAEKKTAPNSAGQIAGAYDPLKESLLLIQSQKYNDSVAVLSKILLKNTKSPDAHYLLAVSYVGLRKYAEAAQQYQHVITIAPNSKLALLAAQGLKKISH